MKFKDLKTIDWVRIVLGTGFWLGLIGFGIFYAFNYFEKNSQQNKVLSEISHPTACSLLEKNEMYASLIGPDSINPSYQVNFINGKTSNNQSICKVYITQGTSEYDGVLTVNYTYTLNKESISNPYTENGNPAYLATFQNNFYTGTALIQPVANVTINGSKYLAGIAAAAADANLPKNTGIKAAK